MKKDDLKRIIKPIVKECINEVLIEEGVLSNIVSEVALGMGATQQVMVESTPQQKAPPQPKTSTVDKKASLRRRKKLMDAIGNDAYNGVDLFENTQPLSGYEAAEPKPGAVDLGDPRDAGVDISSIMPGASKMWEMMK